MELLAAEDGRRVLSSLSPEDLSLVAPAVMDALAKVHALSLPDGGSPVLADCRPCNVMVRCVVLLQHCCHCMTGPWHSHLRYVLHSSDCCKGSKTRLPCFLCLLFLLIEGIVLDKCVWGKAARLLTSALSCQFVSVGIRLRA